MLVSLKLLREILPFEQSAEQLSEEFTLLGLEVEEVVKFNRTFDKVITAKVENLSPVPGTKLFSLIANTGNERFNIITAATNLKNGDVVPLVLPGGKISGGIEIRTKEFQGKRSEGMLCSYKELGLDGEILSTEEKEGILVLPYDAPVGEPFEALFPVDDEFLSLSLLPDRADAFYAVGVARWIEIINARKEGKKADFSKFKPDTNVTLEGETTIPVFVKEPALAPFYSGREIKGVTVKKSSYALRKKLFMLRTRPINNVVDITNYVLKFYGQPLHAFDADKLRNAIIVRKAIPGETIKTLDGVERKLNEHNLVIADSERAVALAGVMGGEETEVTFETKNIFLESAYFAPSCVSRSARSLNLMTDASVLFEKGTDPEFPETASLFATGMIVREAGGIAAKSNISNSLERKRPVKVRFERIGSLLGEKLFPEEIKKYYDFEGFDYEESEEGLLVKAPSFRRDINIEADLIEEVLRMKGYNSFGEKLLEGELKSALRTPEEEFIWELRDLLVRFGLTEVQTVSLIGSKMLSDSMLPEQDLAKVVNPFSEEMSILRPSLFPLLLGVTEMNKKNGTQNIAIFEIGKVFSFDSGKYSETDKIGIILSGNRAEENPFGVSVPYDFYYIKGIVEELLESLGLSAEFSEGSVPFLHPYRTALVRAKGKDLGISGEVSQDVLKNFGIKGKVFYAELSVPELYALSDMSYKYEEFPVQPPLKMDIAIVVDKSVPEEKVCRAILKVAPKELKEIKLFDIYTGKPLKENEKNLAYSLSFFAKDRTMKREETTDFMNKLEEVLKTEVGGKLRKE